MGVVSYFYFLDFFFPEQARMMEGEKVKCCGYHFTSIFTVSFRMVWVINPTVAILGVGKFNILIF